MRYSDSRTYILLCGALALVAGCHRTPAKPDADALWRAHVIGAETAAGANQYAETQRQLQMTLVYARKSGTSVDRALTMSALGRSCINLGKYEESMNWFRQAIAEARKSPEIGPDFIPDTLADLITACVMQGRLVDAGQAAKEMDALDDARLSADDVKRLPHIKAKAMLASHGGRHRSALALMDHYLAVLKASGQADPEHMTVVWNARATDLTALGQYSQAEILYRKALSSLTGTRKPNDASIGRVLAGLASTYAKHGSYGEALPCFRRSASILESSLGPAHPSLYKLYTSYAATLTKAHRPKEAAAMRAKAVDMARKLKMTQQ